MWCILYDIAGVEQHLHVRTVQDFSTKISAFQRHINSSIIYNAYIFVTLFFATTSRFSFVDETSVKKAIQK